MGKIKEMTVSEIHALLKTSSLSETGGTVLNKVFLLPKGVELVNGDLYKGMFSCDVATYTQFTHLPQSHLFDQIRSVTEMNQRVVEGVKCVTVVMAIGGYDTLMPMALRTDQVPTGITQGWFYTGLEDIAAISFTVIPDDKGNEYVYFYGNNLLDDPVLVSVNQRLIKILK